MMRRLALLGLALSIAGAAHADPRVSDRLYRASEIVTVRGGPGVESTIAFAPDERIENIAVGDSVAWQVSPNKRANLLFLKPSSARARTNMTVVTDQRTYLFELVSGSAASAVYMLRFSYPDAPKPLTKPGADAATELAAAAPPPLPTAPPPVLNFAWRAKGEKRLLPAVMFDDGHSTYLRWNKEDTLPAILARSAKGVEGPVNYTVRGEFIVVDGVLPQIVLRSGKQVAVLSPDPRPAPAVATARAEPATSVQEARR